MPTGDTTTVIQYGNGVVGVDGNSDFCTEACQGFVHSIIHDFVYQMVGAPFHWWADIHARRCAPFSQTFKTWIWLSLYSADICSSLNNLGNFPDFQENYPKNRMFLHPVVT